MTRRRRLGGPTWRRRARRAALAFAFGAASAVGCDSSGGVGVGGGGPTGTTGDPERDAALVGEWRRTIVFSGDDGTLYESETTWGFASDGSATRVVVSSNLTDGLHDTDVSTAQWQTRAGSVTITFLTPSTGSATFAYRVESRADGVTLTLDTTPFLRVTP